MTQDQDLGGVLVIVFRARGSEPEYLILHDTDAGEGEWAWGPPKGGRDEGETPFECAQRELLEETGLHLEPVLTEFGDERCWVYLAEAKPGAEVRLCPEHDGFLWVPADEAESRCLPREIGSVFGRVHEEHSTSGSV